jgi:uncharacterized membrane protein
MAILALITAVCSYFKLPFVPYLVSASFIIVLILMLFKKLPEKTFPIFIIGLSLSMIWQQTMIGTYILGTDIHQEFYATNRALEHGWDLKFHALNGTSLLLNVVSPFLAKIGIPIVWQFKLLYPMFLSCVPFVLYLAFSKQISKRWSFYSVMFFIIVPVFTVEIATIVKSMVAELFFALCVLVLYSDIKYLKKGLLLVLLGLLACVTHYTIGTLVIIFLFLISIILLVLEITSHKNNFVSVICATVVIFICGLAWFANTGDGIVYTGYKNSISGILGIKSVVNSDQNYLVAQDSLVQTALGLDWNKTSIHGKAFRIIQYITQLAVAVGLVYIFLNRKKYNFAPEFVAGIISSIVILLLVLFAPSFASILNTTRWYHTTLFFLSPLFVMGLVWIGKEYLVVGILILYYIFTSGFYYQTFQNDMPSYEIETPYSIAYSYNQGMVGIFNKDDVECSKWLSENIGDKMVRSSFTDMYLLFDYADCDDYSKQFTEGIPEKPYYMFISSQSYDMGNLTIWTGPLMRKKVPLPDTSGMEEVFRKNNSVVYYVR